MATTEALAESLGKSLSYDELEDKLKQLEALNDASQQKAVALNLELDQAKSQLEKSQETVRQYERAKEETKLKLDELSISDMRTMHLIISLQKELQEKNAEISDLSGKVTNMKLENINLSMEKAKEGNTVITLMSQNNELDKRLRKALENETLMRHDLLSSENRINTQLEEKRRDLRKYHEEKEILERDRNSLTSQKSILEKKYENCRMELQEMSERAKCSEDKYDKLERNHKKAEKDFNDLITTYEQQSKDLETEAEQLRKKLREDRESACQEMESAMKEISKYKERYEISKMHVEKLLGTSQASEKDGTKETIAPATSNLLKMIQQYESAGKRWEDIYGDFFDLREAYVKLRAENDDLKIAYDKCIRGGTGKQQYYGRMDQELQRLRKKCMDLEKTINEHEITKQKYTKEMDDMEATFEDLKRENKDLSGSLSDTTYQLRYMLREAKSNGSALPPNVKGADVLLSDAQVASSVDHNLVVFKNIDELQQKNQELLSKVRSLSDDIQLKSQEIERLSAQNASAETSSELAKQLAKDNEELQARLNVTSSECATYMRLLKTQKSSNIPGKEDSSDRSDIEERIKEYETVAEETENDLRILRGELKQERDNTIAVRRELLKVNQDVCVLEQKCSTLTRSQERSLAEAEELRRKKDELESRLQSREELLTTANRDLQTLRTTVDDLRFKNIQLAAEHKTTMECYNRLSEEHREISTDRNNLSKLLQDLNTNLNASSTASGQLIEELKSRVEQQGRQLRHAEEQLSEAEKELRSLREIGDNREWQDKYQETKGELQQLRVTHAELEKKLSIVDQERAGLLARLDTLKQLEQDTDANKDSELPDEDEVRNLNKKLLSSQLRIKELERELAQLLEESKKSSDETAQIRQEHKDIVALLNSSIEQVTSELNVRESTIEDLKTKLEQSMENVRQENAEKTQLIESKIELEGTLRQKELLIEEQRDELDRMKESQNRLETIENERKEYAENVAHLEQRIRTLQDELSNAQSEVAESQERIKSAEQSWERQKEQLKQSEEDVRLRLRESENHCKQLMERIEDLVKSLSAHEPSAVPGEEAQEDSVQSKAINELRKVNATLDREKRLWKTRYDEVYDKCQRAEMELEDTKRLLSKTRTTLEDTRKEYFSLSGEKERVLLESKQEADVYRDSNQKLRQEVEELSKLKVVLERNIAAKNAEIEPMQMRIKQLELAVEESSKQVQLLEKSREEWTARSAQIMSKYNKSDPAELEKVKSELQAAKTQLEGVSPQLETLTNERDTLKKSLEELNLRYSKILLRARQLQAQQNRQSEANSTSAGEMQKLTKEKTEAEEKLAAAEAEKAAAVAEKTKAEEEKAKSQEELDKLRLQVSNFRRRMTAQIQKMNEDISNKDKELKDKTEAIESKDKLIQDKLAEIESKDTLIKTMAEEIAGKEKAIQDASRELEAKNQLIKEKAEEMKKKDEKMAEVVRENFRYKLAERGQAKRQETAHTSAVSSPTAPDHSTAPSTPVTPTAAPTSQASAPQAPVPVPAPTPVPVPATVTSSSPAPVPASPAPLQPPSSVEPAAASAEATAQAETAKAGEKRRSEDEADSPNKKMGL